MSPRLPARASAGTAMPGAGLEPARPEGQWILSPWRLPIPPPGQGDPHRRARRSMHRCERHLGMGWLFYSLTTVVQTTILYGVAAALVALAAIAFGQRTAAWSAGTLWVGALSAVCGALGLLTFYLALDRGSASLAVPVIGFYPAVVAVLSVAFLGEKLSALQVVGVALAVAGVALIGAAG